MTVAYRFSNSARPKKPDTEETRLLEKVWTGEKLSREEKDRVASILYGTFSQHKPYYQLAGWQWEMYEQLPRILVRFDWSEDFSVYYAPDKRSLRKALASTSRPIKEMINLGMRGTQKPPLNKDVVAIEVEGGIVSNVVTNLEDVAFYVVDHDEEVIGEVGVGDESPESLFEEHADYRRD